MKRYPVTNLRGPVYLPITEPIMLRGEDHDTGEDISGAKYEGNIVLVCQARLLVTTGERI